VLVVVVFVVSPVVLVVILRAVYSDLSELLRYQCITPVVAEQLVMVGVR